MRISVAVCVSASGQILPPYILIPRSHDPKNPLKNFVPPPNVIMEYLPKKATFNSSTIRDGLLGRVLLPNIHSKNISDPVLFLDRAPPHMHSSVKQKCLDHSVALEFFPPRLTNLLQPLDVTIFRVLKVYNFFKKSFFS